jgi:hypothetical protein
MITIEQREVSRTGVASLGWQMGYGYVSKKVSIVTKVWCVLENGKVIAECRGKNSAIRIRDALES